MEQLTKNTLMILFTIIYVAMDSHVK